MIQRSEFHKTPDEIVSRPVRLAFYVGMTVVSLASWGLVIKLIVMVYRWLTGLQ